MGATRVVTDETFEAEVLKNDKPVIVDYWAEWCGPCRMVAPVLEEIATEYADKIDVVKLNIDENPAVSQRYGIMAIPTMKEILSFASARERGSLHQSGCLHQVYVSTGSATVFVRRYDRRFGE